MMSKRFYVVNRLTIDSGFSKFGCFKVCLSCFLVIVCAIFDLTLVTTLWLIHLIKVLAKQKTAIFVSLVLLANDEELPNDMFFFSGNVTEVCCWRVSQVLKHSRKVSCFLFLDRLRIFTRDIHIGFTSKRFSSIVVFSGTI